MKFYLSSYKLGNEIDKLKSIILRTGKKTVYISNALDFSIDLDRRKKSEDTDILDLENIGMQVEKIDLRDYFGRQKELEQKLSEYNIIWVRGGNVFVLRQAMKLSGFDKILNKLIERDDLLYGAYSAGACVLSPTLRGMDLVDDSGIYPYSNQTETIWDGLDILPYSFVPHYDSNHEESSAVNNVIRYMTENNISFKAVKDGEVLIFEKKS